MHTIDAAPHLAQLDQVTLNTGDPLEAGMLGDADFRVPIRDHYLTNPIARASSLMGQLSAAALDRGRTAIAAE